jgi:hypothetical protein
MARMQWWIRPGAEPRLGDHEPVALAGQHVARRHPDVGEPQLGVPVLVLVPEDGQVADDLQPRGVPGDQDHRLLAVRGAVRVGLAHDDEDLAALVRGTAGPPLAPVDHVVVAVAHHRRLDVAGVGRGDVRLGHREAGPDLALEQRVQPPLLLLGRAEQHERLHVACVRRPAVDGLRGDDR